MSHDKLNDLTSSEDIDASGVAADQLLASDGSAVVAAGTSTTQVSTAVTQSHVQGTDQGLDTGGPNAVTAADVKSAVTDSHTHANKAQLDLITDGDHDVRTDNPHGVTKAQVGLGNVDNTADADKPVSTATQTALDAKVDDTEKGAANGVATLDAGGKIPSGQVPAIALTDVSVVADIPARDALTVQEGDVAVVTDAGGGEPNSYIYDGTTWQELKHPADAVASVNGFTGTVVLDSDDIDDSAAAHKFVTAGDLTNLSNLSGVNTGDEPTATTTAEGVVELATTAETDAGTATDRAVTPASLTNVLSDVSANNAKVTNATHTGEVTGSGALAVDKTAITNKTSVTAAPTDELLIADASDTGNLKKVTVQSIVDNMPADSDINAKVSANDTTTGFLEDKIVGATNKITLSTLNEGLDEDLQITIGTDVFDKTVDDTDDITVGATNKFVTSSDLTNLGNLSGTNSGDEVQATESVAGIAEVATQIETDAGTDDQRIVTPAKLAGTSVSIHSDVSAAQATAIGNLSGVNTGDEPAASTTVPGIVELATTAETDAVTDATRAVTPASLTNIEARITANDAKVSSDLQQADIDTLAELNAIITDATLIDTGDARLSDARTPTGAAGGDLTGTYPNPTIDVDVVDNTNLANMPANTLKGNNTGAAADPIDLTAAQVRTLLNVEDGAAADQSAAEVAFTPDGDIAAATVQAAIVEVRDDTDTKLSAKEDTANKGVAGGYASLDGGGKVPSAQLPALALTEVFVVADITARDALTVQEGDVAVVTDAGGGQPNSFIYDGTAWQELKHPADAVSSVNSQTGTVVLDADDIDDSATAHKFVTAGDLTNLSNLSGTNTGDEPTATTTAEGVVELATTAETDAVTATDRAVTPASLVNIEARITANDAKVTNATHTGDVTGSTALTIANDAVSNAKLANMAANTIKGNNTGGTADPVDLTATQVRTLINVADGANNYSHPNHTGEVTSTGDGAQALANTAITNKTSVTAAATDEILISDASDAGNLKKVTAQSIADLAAGGALTQDSAVATQFGDESRTAAAGWRSFNTPVTVTTSGTGGTKKTRVEFECTAERSGGGTLALTLRIQNTTDGTTLGTFGPIAPGNQGRRLKVVGFGDVGLSKTIEAQFTATGATVMFSGQRILDYQGLE